MQVQPLSQPELQSVEGGAQVCAQNPSAVQSACQFATAPNWEIGALGGIILGAIAGPIGSVVGGILGGLLGWLL
jgi:Bacteriocin class II with double-glycine leader peptide